MTNWRQMLRDHDPGAERLSAEAAARMRDAVVRAARASVTVRPAWVMRAALTGFAGVVLLLTMFAAQRSTGVAPGAPPDEPGTERRQIQFATPGGTRIIWELNPNFTLKETLP